MGTKTVLTLAQFLALPEDDSVRHELDQGELLVTPPPQYTHSSIVSRLVRKLGVFVDAHELGEVFASETGYRLANEPDTIRCPDVSYLRRERVPLQGSMDYIEGAPDLAVEVITASETARQIKRKIQQYFAAGCREVWAVYPDDRETQVYLEPNRYTTVPAGQPLETSLLPGFSLRLSDLLD